MRLRPALALAVLVGGCFGDRARPGPAAPDTEPLLTVQVLSPRHNSTVVAGRQLQVEVLARDLRQVNLRGVGVVARRTQGAEVMDSIADMFDTPQANSRSTFTLTVPAGYPTNTQVDIQGIAFGPGGRGRLSVPISVIVIQCTPGQAGCQ